MSRKYEGERHMTDIRRLIFNSLIRCEENGRYSNIEADTVIKRYSLKERERSFYTALFYGIIEKQITLDYQIKKLSSVPFEKIQTNVLVLLRLGLFQILFTDSVPDRAAVNETVALAKQAVNSGACGYINGLLRTASDKLKKEGKISLITPNREKDICGYLSIKYSYPRYLCKLWINAYGEEKTEKIMLAQSKPQSTTIRINTLKTTFKEYLCKLLSVGYTATTSSCCPDGIKISGNAPITSLPDFENGYFFVQDDSSRLCVEALDPTDGDIMLDACACPGGKSFASALKMNNRGKIISCDIHKSKLSLIKSGAKRLGIDIIETLEADSSVYIEAFCEKFDKVLCDVPCSGFGTISKKADLRLKPCETTERLPDIQLAIITNCASYVKKGGTLVYSTCTLNPSENECNVRRFLELRTDFRLEVERTCFPYEAEYDGFYFAKLIRENG